jgi:hypothetical protein
MIKKHRMLLISLLVVRVGMFVYCTNIAQWYEGKRASAQINGYRVDFVRDNTDSEFMQTYLEITRPDGKVSRTMTTARAYRNDCPDVAIQHVGFVLYFLCADEEIIASTPYLDIGTMLLYDGERDNTPTPIDSLDYN